MDVSWHMERSIPVPETGCWIWLGAEKGNGYGNVRSRGKNLPAHRMSYLQSVGPIPAGMHVCHKCDTRLCVNPEHLFLGSRLENMQDAMRKGRISRGAKHSLTVRGEKAGRAKLSAAQVQAIRRVSSALPTSEIAALTGVTADNVRRIVRHDTWKEDNQCAA